MAPRTTGNPHQGSIGAASAPRCPQPKPWPHHIALVGVLAVISNLCRLCQTMNEEESTTKQTALWIIGCVLVTMFCAYSVYTYLTAETHEQCIEGSTSRDGQECWKYETRPGPDTQMAFWMAWLSIIPILMAVKLIREAHQRRNVTPTPWGAFWRTVNLIWKARQRRDVTPTPWWAFWR